MLAPKPIVPPAPVRPAAPPIDDGVDDDGFPVSAKAGMVGDAASKLAKVATTPVNYADDGVDDNGNPVNTGHGGLPAAGVDPSDIFGSAAKQVGIGLHKGAQEGGTGALKLLQGAYGIGAGDAKAGDFGPFDQPGVEEEIYKPLEAENFLQGTGKFIEQVGEAWVPGSMVDKSVKLTKALPLAKRLGSAMWKEAVANAGQTFVHTGGDVEAAAASGVTGGLVRGAISSPLFLRDQKLIKETLDEAQRFGIPLTKAEQTQSSIRRFIDFMVSRSVGGARTMAGFKVMRNSMLENTARSIADAVDPNAMDPRSMGQYVQQSLDQVKDAATQELQQATGKILSGHAGSQALDLGQIDAATGKYTPSQFVQAARDVIAEQKFPEIENLIGGSAGGTDNVNEAYSILRRVANPVKTEVTDPIAHAMDPTQGLTKTVVPLDVATARKLRTLLFDKSAFSETTTGKASIQQLNKALHEEMIGTLNRNGMATEAADFEAASTQYKETLRKLESRVISHLSKRGDMGAQQVTPEVIATILRGSEAETTAIELQKLLRPDQIERVRGSLLKQSITDAEHSRGYWDVEKFKRDIDSFGDEGGKAVYGPALYQELKDFSAAAEKYRIVPSTVSHATGESLPMLAQLRLGGVGYMAMKVLSDFNITKADALPIMAAGVETIGMNIAARMLTRPSVVNDLTKAMAADPVSTVGKQLAARLSASVMKAYTEERQDENRRRAEAEVRGWASIKPPTELPPPPPVE